MEVIRPLKDLLQDGFHSIESQSRLKSPNLSFFYKSMTIPLKIYSHKGEGKAQREKKIKEQRSLPLPAPPGKGELLSLGQ